MNLEAHDVCMGLCIQQDAQDLFMALSKPLVKWQIGATTVMSNLLHFDIAHFIACFMAWAAN